MFEKLARNSYLTSFKCRRNMMDNQFTEMGRQLAHPTGEAGLQLADLMHETNIGMTTAAADALHIGNDCTILELGHGNCSHLEMLLVRGRNIKYCGLEVSDDMYREAIRRNQSRVIDGSAEFKLYDGEAVPFENAMFNAIMNVNTIYFWSDPVATCRELLRVLKPGGFISIAFAQKTFMEQLPFTKEKFKLVDTADVNNILESAGLKIVRIIDEVEKVNSKAGELVDRPYTVVVASNVP